MIAKEQIKCCMCLFQCFENSDVLDLKQLKAIHPGASIRQGDFSPLICQNCDAAGRVLNQKVVDELSKYVPGSEGTQMYLQAQVWIHAPYRESNFGTPRNH